VRCGCGRVLSCCCLGLPWQAVCPQP
jgi:hypothetical protein